MLDSYLLDRIVVLKEFGPRFLEAHEFDKRQHALLSEYFALLGVAFVNFRGADYWNYHRDRLAQLRYGFHDRRMVKAVCMKLLDLIFNPKNTLERMIRRIKGNPLQRPR